MNTNAQINGYLKLHGFHTLLNYSTRGLCIWIFFCWYLFLPVFFIGWNFFTRWREIRTRSESPILVHIFIKLHVYWQIRIVYQCFEGGRLANSGEVSSRKKQFEMEPISRNALNWCQIGYELFRKTVNCGFFLFTDEAFSVILVPCRCLLLLSHEMAFCNTGETTIERIFLLHIYSINMT